MGTISPKPPKPPSPGKINEKKPVRILSHKDLDFTDLVISNKEDVTLIWLDENMNRRDDVLATKTLFQAANYYVLLCADKETCLRSIQLITREKIVLVLSGHCAQDIVTQVHSCPQLDSAFIFCMKPDRYQNLLDKKIFPKLHDIYVDHASLFRALTGTIAHIRRHLLAFTLFSPKTRLRHLTSDSAEFMWFLLLKEALILLPIDETSKQHMVEYCRDYYRYDPANLIRVEEFNRTYKPSDAILWYARSSFVAHLVNKALRTEDSDLLYTFRFFIVDLSTSLRSLATLQSSVKDEILHLYRGLTLSLDEIDQLRSNIGHLMSPNGFMSASRNPQVAHIYGTNAVFEIEVDTRLNLCADIQQQSPIKDEEEIVFNLGTTFHVKNVQLDPISKTRWLIQLLAVPDGDRLVREVFQLNNTNRADIFFGELIYLMGEYDKAKRYFFKFRQQYNKQPLPIVDEQKFNKLKMKYKRRLCKITDRELINSTSTLVLIAETYQMVGNSTKAMEHLETALATLSPSPPRTNRLNSN